MAFLVTVYVPAGAGDHRSMTITSRAVFCLTVDVLVRPELWKVVPPEISIHMFNEISELGASISILLIVTIVPLDKDVVMVVDGNEYVVPSNVVPAISTNALTGR